MCVCDFVPPPPVFFYLFLLFHSTFHRRVGEEGQLDTGSDGLGRQLSPTDGWSYFGLYCSRIAMPQNELNLRHGFGLQHFHGPPPPQPRQRRGRGRGNRARSRGRGQGKAQPETHLPDDAASSDNATSSSTSSRSKLHPWSGIEVELGTVAAGWWSEDKRHGPCWMYIPPNTAQQPHGDEGSQAHAPRAVSSRAQAPPSSSSESSSTAPSSLSSSASAPCLRLVWFKANKVQWEHTVRRAATRNRAIRAIEHLRALSASLTLSNLESLAPFFRRHTALACREMVVATFEFLQQGLRAAQLASFAVRCENNFAHLFTDHGQVGQSELCALLRHCGRHHLYESHAVHACHGVRTPSSSLEVIEGDSLLRLARPLAAETAEQNAPRASIHARWPPPPVSVRPLLMSLHKLCKVPKEKKVCEAHASGATMERFLDLLCKRSSESEMQCLVTCPQHACPGTSAAWRVPSTLLWRGCAITSDAGIQQAVAMEIRAMLDMQAERAKERSVKRTKRPRTGKKQSIAADGAVHGHGDERGCDEGDSSEGSDENDNEGDSDEDNTESPEWIQFTHLCWNQDCPNRSTPGTPPGGAPETAEMAGKAPHKCFFCKVGPSAELQAIRSYSNVGVKGSKDRQDIFLHDLCLLFMPEYPPVGNKSLADILTRACRNPQFMQACPQCRLPGTTLQCCGSSCVKTYHFGCAWKAGCAFTVQLGWKIFCPDCLAEPKASTLLAFPARHSFLEWTGIITANPL